MCYGNLCHLLNMRVPTCVLAPILYGFLPLPKKIILHTTHLTKCSTILFYFTISTIDMVTSFAFTKVGVRFVPFYFNDSYII